MFGRTESSGRAPQWGDANGEVSDSVEGGFLTASKWGYLREKNISILKGLIAVPFEFLVNFSADAKQI